MRKSRFSEAQIVAILRDGRGGRADQRPGAAARDQPATYFLWRSKYAGTSVSELKRMKELEAENTKLKRMYAELALENAAIKDVLQRKL
jgi:putative transposase